MLKANREVDLWDLRLIRRELNPLGLDWKRPAFPAPAAVDKVSPLRVQVVEAPANHPAQAWRIYWRLRGEGDRLRGAWTEAAIDFTEALKILPANAPAHAELLQRRAESYAHLRAYDAARADWEQVVALEPGLDARSGEPTATDRLMLALCYTRLGQPIKARDYYDRAVHEIRERQSELSANAREELKEFRAEADRVLGPAAPR